jgi:hypothetical protein
MSSTHGDDYRKGQGRFGFPKHEEAPLLVAGSKDPLKEIYQGRWKQLPVLHKFGVVVVFLPMSAFVGVFLVWPFLHAEAWSRLFEIVIPVAGSLLCLLVILLYIRHFRESELPAAKNLNEPAAKKR